jgi:hypothetical protein
VLVKRQGFNMKPVDAGLSPRELVGVAVHGTGTPLGDPIEIGALGQALGTSGGTSDVTVGAVKSCYGHTEGAAGLTGSLLSISMLTTAVCSLASFALLLLSFPSTWKMLVGRKNTIFVRRARPACGHACMRPCLHVWGGACTLLSV